MNRNNNNIIIILWIALAAVLFITTTAAFIQAHTPLAAGGAGDAAEAKSFDVSSGDTLRMQIDSGDIYLNTWDRNVAQISTEGIVKEDHLTMSQSGKTVNVEYRTDGWGGGSARFYVQLPATMNLDLNTSGGDIEIKGGVAGLVNARTSGGDIRLADVQGKTEVHTSGGDIRAGRIKGEATLETSGGDIVVDSVSSQVVLHTSGGDIKVGDVGKTLDASTAGGDVIVGDVGGEAIVSTAGGDIQMGKVSGSAKVKTAGGDIILKGASGAVTAKTAGGDLRLENVTGSIQGETAGGDVIAELIPRGQGPSTLKSAGGDIELALPETAKVTVDATIRIRGRWSEAEEEYVIRSDFKAKFNQRDQERKEIHAQYDLNGGGERIELQTTNGNIMIKKLLSAERQ